MIQNDSLTRTKKASGMNRRMEERRRYKLAYRRFRQYGDCWDFLYMYDSSNEIVQAAEYAYEAKDYHVSGWSDRRRRVTFLNRKADISGELPF